MGLDQPVHWVVVLAVAALLFGGYKKLPEMARSAGRSMRIFKTELKGMADDDEARAAANRPAEAATAFPAVPAAPPTAPAVAPVSTPVAAPQPIAPPADTQVPQVPVSQVPMAQVPAAPAPAPQQASDPTAPPSS